MSKFKKISTLRTDNQKSLENSRSAWKKVADERLSREQAGDSFNPWLAIKQAYYDLQSRIPEAYLSNTDPLSGSPMTDQRNQAFEQSLEDIRQSPTNPPWKKLPY